MPAAPSGNRRLGAAERSLLRFAKLGNLARVGDLLLSGDVNVDACGRSGWTALHYAVDAGYVGVADALILSHADTTLRTGAGQSILDLAVTKSSAKMLDYVLSVYADPCSADARGWTALHRAANVGFEYSVRRLIDAGLNVDAQTVNGTTALQLAAGLDEIGCMRALLEAGADPELRDRQNRSAWGHAHEARQGQSLALLNAWVARRAAQAALEQSQAQATSSATPAGAF
jgi:ankyrin repeat protein